MTVEKRFSKQRQAILDDLVSRHDHPSADAVYENVKKVIPNISLGTVYRNLKELAADGVILRLSRDGKDCFDGNPDLHLHFICKKCGKIYDLDKSKMSIDESEVIGLITNVSIDGICDKCL